MRALLLLSVLMLTSAAAARDFRLCVDANDWAPYTHPDHDGTLQMLVRQAAARQGDSVTFVALPWLRCEANLNAGSLDGLLGEPWSAVSRDKFAFPLKEGKADTSRAVAGIDIVLLNRVEDPVVWNGRSLMGLQGKAAYVQGNYEIEARLDALGIANSDEYRSNAQIVKALLAGRTNVAALFVDAAQSLAESDDYRGKLAVLAPPLAHISYYVAFSPPFYAGNREAVEGLWRSVAELRVGEEGVGNKVSE